MFRTVLRPSSVAQELYTEHLVHARLAAATARMIGSTTLAVAAASLAHTRCCVYSS
jgi:hypothetical protein